jgi:ligand-binding SRPBCC domain-containing protein
VTVRFGVTTPIAAPAEIVFDLSLDIDAHLGSMAASGEQAIAGVTGGQIGLGEQVTWRARHLGIWWTMTSRVTELDRPRRFVDEQVRGPFARFHHEHRFLSRDDGGTDMVDIVTFTAPAGPVGVVAEALVLRRLLTALIEQRGRYLKTEAERPRT